MCMTIKEMNETMEQIKEWKRIKEQAEDNISALNAKAIEFLNEFTGTIFKATLSVQERESVDKSEVKKLLSAEEYRKVSKVSIYPVLRIS